MLSVKWGFCRELSSVMANPFLEERRVDLTLILRPLFSNGFHIGMAYFTFYSNTLDITVVAVTLVNIDVKYRH